MKQNQSCIVRFIGCLTCFTIITGHKGLALTLQGKVALRMRGKVALSSEQWDSIRSTVLIHFCFSLSDGVQGDDPTDPSAAPDTDITDTPSSDTAVLKDATYNPTVTSKTLITSLSKVQIKAEVSSYDMEDQEMTAGHHDLRLAVITQLQLVHYMATECKVLYNSNTFSLAVGHLSISELHHTHS